MDELETICALYYEISGKIMVEGKLDSRGGRTKDSKWNVLAQQMGTE